jgi:serine/threonine protein kinase
VLDFGVAKIINSDSTDEGTVFGTVNYMAPEYLQSGRPDSRSDLFAVGVILYEALAGSPPFDGPSPGAVIYRLLHDTPAPLPPTACLGVSPDVQALLNQALGKDPSTRYQSAESLAVALRSAKEPTWRWGEVRSAAASRPKPSAPGGSPTPRATPASVTATGGRPKTLQTKPAGGAPGGRGEVRRDLLETTLEQLTQALEIDPTNARVHALLLVTYFQLDRLEAVMWVLRSARTKGILAEDLRLVPRCERVVQQEARAIRLPLAAHGEFMEYFGL